VISSKIEIFLVGLIFFINPMLSVFMIKLEVLVGPIDLIALIDLVESVKLIKN
jgi:hypothetical protein